MKNEIEFNRKESRNKSNNLTYIQITNSNLSKIKLCELVIPYCLVADWCNLNIFFSDIGMVCSVNDFKKATDVIYNSLLYN